MMGHLIHGEKADWMERLVIILEHGPAKPFAPFDREAQFREGEKPSPGGVTRRIQRIAVCEPGAAWRVATDGSPFGNAGDAPGIWFGDGTAVAGHLDGA